MVGTLTLRDPAWSTASGCRAGGAVAVGPACTAWHGPTSQCRGWRTSCRGPAPLRLGSCSPMDRVGAYFKPRQQPVVSSNTGVPLVVCAEVCPRGGVVCRRGGKHVAVDCASRAHRHGNYLGPSDRGFGRVVLIARANGQAGTGRHCDVVVGVKGVGWRIDVDERSTSSSVTGTPSVRTIILANC